MKIITGCLPFVFACLHLLIMTSPAQETAPLQRKYLTDTFAPTHPGQPHSATTLSTYRSPKRPGHYSSRDWRALIDSLWGPGPSTDTKLQIFDTFWNLIDRQYPGFPYLQVNWDSLKAIYRPEIQAGVSRGRLWGILGHLYLSLQEIHTWIADLALDEYFMENGKLVYRPGIPAFFPSGWGWAGSFGAALTPLPDSSLLVYRAITPHPMGIVAGDIVLGYDRIPWKRLYRELLAAELPLEWWGETGYGSSPRSMTHALLASAGSNWGLFDTLDLAKYATGDTLHLSTAPLLGQDYMSLFATEQVPVPGVRLPDYRKGERVSGGIVDGTSVGYVYVYTWDAAVGPVFAATVRDLIMVKKAEGLILDFRYNLGSADSWTAPNAGLDYLFNEDPAGMARWRSATRSIPTDHFGFSFSAPPASFQALPDYYDRPIAVLTGPQTWSVGEHTAFRMRFHPMARFFGLPTNGAFVMGGGNAGPIFGSWYYRFASGQMQSLVNNEGFLMHKSFPVDEEVWLTREGVAKGEDDVVKRAQGWITTLSYAHDVHVTRHGRDTIDVLAPVQNPLGHSLVVTASLYNSAGSFLDSLALADDGHHGDGPAGDGLWACTYVPAKDETLFVNIRTTDLTAGTSRSMSNVARYVFTRKALITVDTRTVELGGLHEHPDRVDTSFMVWNAGYMSDSLYVWLSPATQIADSAMSVTPMAFALAPGDSQKVTFSVRPGLLSPNIQYSVEVVIDSRFAFGQTQFSKLITFDKLTGVRSQDHDLPGAFALRQNYPNPFNPSTTITYDLPRASHVRLAVFGTLGQIVAELVHENKPAGTHTVRFDGSRLASGIYLYRLQAESFTQTRKLLILH